MASRGNGGVPTSGMGMRIVACFVGLGWLLGVAPFTLAMTYEEWARGNFGGSDDERAGPAWDPDFDGLSNLEEYAFFLDPLRPDPNPQQARLKPQLNGLHYLVLQFSHRREASDLSIEVRGAESPGALCESGSVVYRWEEGRVTEDVGVLSATQNGDAMQLAMRDPWAPLESGRSQGFLQVFVEWRPVAAPIAFVRVGDPGKGGVEQAFELGEFEVTNAQYTEFLNAVARADRDYRAYSPFMGSLPQGGIERSGEFGEYVYRVRPRMGDKPAAFVSFWAACRFCNWMHHGRPSRCGRMTASTTEDGAYDLTLADTLQADQVVRKPGARYFLPADEEWVKAAFYDATRDQFWDYATGSNVLPQAAQVDADGNILNHTVKVVNYGRTARWDSDRNGRGEANVSTVGSGGDGSRSPYGAADMAGNVAEWTETAVGNWGRIQRGGSWNHLPSQIHRDYLYPLVTFGTTVKDTGFRVARAVEP